MLTAPFAKIRRKDKAAGYAFPQDRVAEIRDGTGFHCHRTLEYDRDDGEATSTEQSQTCAGWLALHRSTRPMPQIMQIASRIGWLDLDALDLDRVSLGSWDAAERAYSRARRR